MRIADGILWNAGIHPDKAALVMDGTVVTYGELKRFMDRVAISLYDKGFRPTNRVAIILENRLEYVELFLGFANAGLVVSPVNPRLSEDERAAILAELKPDLVVCESDGIVYVNKTAGSSASVPLTEWLGNELTFQKAGCHFELCDDDLFYLGFSSGTTGRPKGILRTHRSWTDSFFAMSVEFRLDESTCMLIPGPLAYSASLIACLHILFIGGTVILHGRFDAKTVVKTIMDEPVNAAFMVPAMYQEILNVVQDMKKPLTKRKTVFVTAGDKMNEGTKRGWGTCFPNALLYEYYGTSEVGFVSVLKPEDQLKKSDTVGRPFFTASVKCVDEEIWVKSTMGFAGYDGHHPELETKIRREHLWLATSDMGFMDADGYLHVTGRMEEKMVCGGFNIYPAEIRTVLERHQDVAEAFVFAVPDERLGDKPVAVIVWKNGITDSDVQNGFEQFLKQSLTGYKRPRFWWSRSELPRNASGKVLKSVLAVEYDSKMNF